MFSRSLRDVRALLKADLETKVSVCLGFGTEVPHVFVCVLGCNVALSEAVVGVFVRDVSSLGSKH